MTLNKNFLGGPRKNFIREGREQLIVLLEHGLDFDSVLLDIGCGVLRGSRWSIPLLAPGNFCGIEPQRHMVERGLREFLDPDIAALKRPRFDHNDRFDFSVFGLKFTHFIARSIWSHASKPQIETMLDGVVDHGVDGAVFLTSFHLARGVWTDYEGDEWRGRSHESGSPDVVAHSYEWIERQCHARDLSVAYVDRDPLWKQDQRWLVIRKPGELPERLPGEPGRVKAPDRS
jgi:hypothetical protein